MNMKVLVTDEALERKLQRHLERRELPDAFLYTGPRGAANWLALESSWRFPVASTLTALMKEWAGAVVERARYCRDVVSIGAGDARKERLLLRELLRFSRPVCHIVDISRAMVDEALRNLAPLGLETRGIVAFCENLDILSPAWRRPVLFCLLGNNFCNYQPADLLPLVGANLGRADLFLLDGSLLPGNVQDTAVWQQEIEEIYNAPENARFNIAPLVARGADEESCRFELRLTAVDTPWGPTYRTQKRIHVTKPTTVRCGTEAVALHAGDRIEMGFTYRYRGSQLVACLERYGFDVVERWSDRADRNTILLARKRTAETEP
jgi:uncharacterized SAM-dependent methyltransferase